MGVWMIEVYSAHITEVANSKENLLRGLEFHDWNNQVKTDSPVFVKHNFTVSYTKKELYYWPGTTKESIGD